MSLSKRVELVLGFTAILGIATVFVFPPGVFIYVMALLPIAVVLILLITVWRSREVRRRVSALTFPAALFFFGILIGLFYLNPNRLANKLSEIPQALAAKKVLMIGQPLPAVSQSQSNQIIELQSRLETAEKLGLANGAEPYLEAGVLSFASSKFSDAVKFFGTSGRFAVHSGVITNDLGVAYYSNGSTDEAETEIGKAVEYAKEPDVIKTSKPTLAIAYNNLGMVLREKGKVDDALEKFRLALESSSDQETILIIKLNMASVYQLEGNYEEAIKLADEALNTPEIPLHLIAYAHRVKGIVQEEKKDLEAASNSYQAAATLYEELGQMQELALSYHDLGNAYLAMPHPDAEKAFFFFQSALNINQRLANTIEIAFNYSSLASLYMEKGELNEAESYAQQALEIFSQKDHLNGQAAVLDTLGSIYLKRSDQDRAFAFFQKSLQIARQT